MAQYEDDIAALIATLNNPRYATSDPPNEAPILFDGIFSSVSQTTGYQPHAVHFTAHPNDLHDWGLKVWSDAQAGLYGPIAPYVPFVPAIREKTVGYARAYFAGCIEQVVPDISMMGGLEHATAIIARHGGKAPNGKANGKAAGAAAFKAVADGWAMPVNDFVAFALALDAFRLVYDAEYSALRGKVQSASEQKPMEAAKVHFIARMAAALAEYNQASPRKINPPTLSRNYA